MRNPSLATEILSSGVAFFALGATGAYAHVNTAALHVINREPKGSPARFFGSENGLSDGKSRSVGRIGSVKVFRNPYADVSTLPFASVSGFIGTPEFLVGQEIVAFGLLPKREGVTVAMCRECRGLAVPTDDGYRCLVCGKVVLNP